MQTILLDTGTYDLVLDVNGNVAVASEPYSLAQDAASAIRTFQGEVYYDTTQGVPYWTRVLGKSPSIATLKALFVQAALTVPGVVAARCFIDGIGSDRLVTGQVQVTDEAGNLTAAAF